MLLYAHAKINLGLFITGRLSNGYHKLNSLFMPIGLYDKINLVESDVDFLTVSGKFTESVPSDERNLVLKGLRLLRDNYSIPYFKINLEKNIPNQAGLGGGSSDLARVLSFIIKSYELKIPDRELKELIYKLGADVFFFMQDKPALVKGIGDIVIPFQLKRDYSVALLKPPIKISTKLAYSKLTLKKYNVNEVLLLDILATEGLENVDSLHLLHNDLETASLELAPELAEARVLLEGYGPMLTMMSGSGSTFFALFEGDGALRLKRPTLDAGWFFYTTSLLR